MKRTLLICSPKVGADFAGAGIRAVRHGQFFAHQYNYNTFVLTESKVRFADRGRYAPLQLIQIPRPSHFLALGNWLAKKADGFHYRYLLPYVG